MPDLTIYCNADLPHRALELLRGKVGRHRLIAPKGRVFGSGGGQADADLLGADVAFGQPDVGQAIASPRLAWVHLASAGYTPYDRADLREAFQQRGAALTKSSLVYEEPCAEHLVAFMYAQARQLPAAFTVQHEERGWPQLALRARSRLLRGQSTVVVGLGSIARRLIELLGPLQMNVLALRREVQGDEPVRAISWSTPEALRALHDADHVINTLPGAPATNRFFDAARFASFKPGATFYNVGRGTTVDQPALIAALASGHLAAAYLDVTTPEPLPPDDPLWAAPNCVITPHTAGGHEDEPERLVLHFVENLRRFSVGDDLLDRVF